MLPIPQQQKATVTVGNPSGTTNTIVNNNNPTQGQIWSYCAGEIISDMVADQSPLMRWLPTRAVNTWNEHVAHLSWAAGIGFDGSDTYLEYIERDDPTAECEYGEGGMDFNVCEYVVPLKRVSTSNKNQPLNRQHFGGMKYCENTPVLRIRGEMQNLPIDNDADWITALLALDLESHLHWNLIYGDSEITTSKGLYDGLETILTTGYVKDRHIGEGSCVWTDPLIYQGATLDTPEKVLRRLKFGIRLIRQRMMQRGYTPTGDDMVIAMTQTHYSYLADYIATGVLSQQATSDIQFTTTPEVWERQRERLSSGGIGYGYIPVDGVNIPVIPEELLGSNVDFGETPGVIGDIMVLTKRFRGRNILEHQYMDWSKMGATPAGTPQFPVMQNGMIRTSWQEVNSLCYYYALEMYARIVSYYQPFQMVIKDVFVETELENELEGSSYVHENFYAYEGRRGGGGTPLLESLTAA